MAGQTYTIKAGDTLSGIGARYGLNYNDIAKWNNIANPNLIRAGSTINLFSPQAAAPAPTPAASSGRQFTYGTASGSNSTIPGTNIPAPNEVTPFEKVLPYEKVFNPTLINDLATQQLKPELDRQQHVDKRDLWRNLAMTGAYRTGHAGVQNQRLMDNYSRALKEQTAQFTGQVNDWTQDWYNRQYESYYKNPARFTLPKLPSFDDYLKMNPVTGPGSLLT